MMCATCNYWLTPKLTTNNLIVEFHKKNAHCIEGCIRRHAFILILKISH